MIEEKILEPLRWAAGGTVVASRAALDAGLASIQALLKRYPLEEAGG